jgi:hypothetical protein
MFLEASIQLCLCDRQGRVDVHPKSVAIATGRVRENKQTKGTARDIYWMHSVTDDATH